MIALIVLLAVLGAAAALKVPAGLVLGAAGALALATALLLLAVFGLLALVLAQDGCGSSEAIVVSKARVGCGWGCGVDGCLLCSGLASACA
jgi:hypothetical protein